MSRRSSMFYALLVVAAAAPLPAQTNLCESLASLTLTNVTITMAQSVAAGELPQTGRGGRAAAPLHVPAFCRVAATLKPSSDSDIKMELWLPVSGWNGNFEGNGNGGWTGSVSSATLAAGLNRGYAAGMSDLGHEGGSASFALGHPEKLIDFGYRATHEMTEVSKAIVTKYYGRAPKYSFWNGCSAGGRQGLMEAQRYPADYDGIVAGSPGLNWTGRAVQSVWIAQAVHKDEASSIPPEKFALIHNAVLQACDARDGVKDGVLEDPTRCHFDPEVLQCKGSGTSECLTSEQIETVRKIYAAPTNPRTHQVIFPGFEPGSEMGWRTMAGPQPFGLGTDLFKYIVFQDPNWDYKTFDFDRDEARTELADHGVMNAMNPDLRPFAERGGKLVQYHGWADPQIAPGSSVTYYKNVMESMGGAAPVQNFYRLFMVPGMAHCGGGDGTSIFDMLGAVEQWVEKGKAPDQVPASRERNGQVDRTRPLCPYPQVAQYKGSGSTDEAANFVCKAQ
jgi:tannase/feruloyl esterase